MEKAQEMSRETGFPPEEFMNEEDLVPPANYFEKVRDEVLKHEMERAAQRRREERAEEEGGSNKQRKLGDGSLGASAKAEL